MSYVASFSNREDYGLHVYSQKKMSIHCQYGVVRTAEGMIKLGEGWGNVGE